MHHVSPLSAYDAHGLEFYQSPSCHHTLNLEAPFRSDSTSHRSRRVIYRMLFVPFRGYDGVLETRALGRAYAFTISHEHCGVTFERDVFGHSLIQPVETTKPASVLSFLVLPF